MSHPKVNRGTRNRHSPFNNYRNLPTEAELRTPSTSVERQEPMACFGLSLRVSQELQNILRAGKCLPSDLNRRVLDGLKQLPEEEAMAILKHFAESSLEYVSNKSAYLHGLMQSCRERTRKSYGVVLPTKRPNDKKIKAIIEKTGYMFEVTARQRKYGGPPPGWSGPIPESECQVFVGNIPKDTYEDVLIPLLEKCGKIWDLRLMTDAISRKNRGYAFVTFCDELGAQTAVQKLNGYEILTGKTLKVNKSVPNLRIFVANIPKDKTGQEIFEELSQLTKGISEVLVNVPKDYNGSNPGFCIVVYESHKSASFAKWRLDNRRIWGRNLSVEWAYPEDEDGLNVKGLYVGHLARNITKARIREMFEEFGKVNGVKKLKDFAFVDFENRESALRAMETLDGKVVDGSLIKVNFARPSTDKNMKNRIRRSHRSKMFPHKPVTFDDRPASLTHSREHQPPPSCMTGNQDGDRVNRPTNSTTVPTCNQAVIRSDNFYSSSDVPPVFPVSEGPRQRVIVSQNFTTYDGSIDSFGEVEEFQYQFSGSVQDVSGLYWQPTVPQQLEYQNYWSGNVVFSNPWCYDWWQLYQNGLLFFWA